jgi:hypothetical protein
MEERRREKMKTARKEAGDRYFMPLSLFHDGEIYSHELILRKPPEAQPGFPEVQLLGIRQQEEIRA